MKRFYAASVAMLFLAAFVFMPAAFAIQNTKSVQTKKSVKTAPSVEIAFVFDSNAEKTEQITKEYRPIISKSLLPEYKAVFSDDLVFKGDWTQKGSIEAANKALQSKAKIIICFGYWSGEYLKNKKDKTKSVIIVDQYAIRGFSDKFFNPVQQSVNDFVVFQRIMPSLGKTAILLNERVYNSRNDWYALAEKGFKEKDCDIDFVILPVNNNITQSLNDIPDDVQSAYITQVYNLTLAERQELYEGLKERKIASFSSMGQDDVEAGALFGTSTQDLDQKLAEMASFSIKNVIKGGVVQSRPVVITDNNVLYFNEDTAKAIGYQPHIRLLKSVVVISKERPKELDLSYVFKTFEDRNLSVQRKKFLVSAARRSLASAYLRYLPSARVSLGGQWYNGDYAYSYQDVPTKAGAVTFGVDQVIYSPDLVTNIIVKHKRVKFDKAEKVLTEQNLELEVAQLYVETLMLKNKIDVQEEYVKEVRDNVAIAKTRMLSGFCGKEEVLRWTGELNKAEEELLVLNAAYDNMKIHISQMLYSDQTLDYSLKALTTDDPSFFLSDINLIDHIRTPEKISQLTQMLIKAAIVLAPETTKLKAAIAMKKAEMANYAQKFILPNAKISYEYTNQFGRELPYYDYISGNIPGVNGLKQLRYTFGDGSMNVLNENSHRLFIGAEWRPIEGGTKIAEIARCKSELNELRAYLDEVETEIEMSIRSVVNRAVARYLCIERAYRAMFAEEENYKMVKANYLKNKATIAQTLDALQVANNAKHEAKNSQYEFFKELIWVQRALVSVNWQNASEDSKNFIKNLGQVLPAEKDIDVSL